jgi:hypothetical protein
LREGGGGRGFFEFKEEINEVGFFNIVKLVFFF